MESKNKPRPIIRAGVFCKVHLQDEIGKLIEKDKKLKNITIFPNPPFGWEPGDTLDRCVYGQEVGFWSFMYNEK